MTLPIRHFAGWCALAFAAALSACGTLSPDPPPPAYSLTGTWKLNPAASTDTQKALQALNPRHEVSAPDPFVLPDPNPQNARDLQRRPIYRPPLDIQLTELRGGEWLQIEQKPDELVITNGARVRSFTPGQKSVVSVPSGVADQRSGWSGREYIIILRPQLGPSSEERYKLSDDGKHLTVTIKVASEGRNRSLTVTRVYDRASEVPQALPGSD
jgi:hypothetical protein